jgi:hypothetical protein
VVEEAARAGTQTRGLDALDDVGGELRLGRLEKGAAQRWDEPLRGEEVEHAFDVDRPRGLADRVRAFRGRLGDEAHEGERHVPLGHGLSLISAQ